MQNTGNDSPLGEEQVPKEKPKHGRRAFLKGVLGAVAALLVIAVAALALRAYGVIRFPWDPTPLPNVSGRIMQGTIDREDEQRKVDDATVRIQLAARPRFDDGDAEGELMIINAPENTCILRVEIRLKDTNQLVYDSGMLPPNTYIEQDKLAVRLDKGEYPAIATVYTYDLENPGEPLSQNGFTQIITILE